MISSIFIAHFLHLICFSPIVNTGKIFVNVCVGRVLGEPPLSGRKVVGLVVLLAGILLQLTA